MPLMAIFFQHLTCSLHDYLERKPALQSDMCHCSTADLASRSYTTACRMHISMHAATIVNVILR